MKKIILFAFSLLFSINASAQVIYKTQFEAACERTGVVYRVRNKEVGSIPYKKGLGKGEGEVSFVLHKFADEHSGEMVSCFTMNISGWTGMVIKLDCSEIDSFIEAISLVMNDNELKYIAKTANLCLSGNDLDGSIDILLPSPGSRPGDFSFYRQGSIESGMFVKMLATIKRMSIEL